MVGNRKNIYSDLVLVDNKKSNSAIVIAENPNKKVIIAAKDLQNMIFEMTQCKLDIINDTEIKSQPLILVGPSRLTTEMEIYQPKGYPDNEKIIVKRIGQRVILMGNDDGVFNGTQFAVTRFLEYLGCGWFGIEKLWHVIPTKQQIKVGYLNIEHTPRFESRQNWVLWTNPEIGKRWYLGGTEKEIEHAFWKLFPREKYFEEHPEWYCMVDGKRNPYIEWWQMCYSNQEVKEKTASKIKDFFRNNPLYTQATLSANDGFFEGFCECENCKNLGTPSEVIANFVNDIAYEIENEFPDKDLMFFIYFPTYDPPRTKIKLHKNVTLMFCKEACMNHPVDTGPDCGYHIKYIYEFGHDYYELNWLDNAKKWIEMTQVSNIAIWDWHCVAAANPVWKDLPWVQGDVTTRNLNCFEKLGAKYVYYDQGPVETYNDTEQSYPLRWPLWYVSAKSMWDPNPTASQLIKDACKKLFEGAADVMYMYYMCLAEINESCDAKAMAWHMPEPYEIYTQENIEKIDNIVDIIESVKNTVSKNAKLRIENQIELWEKAKKVIENYKEQEEIN